MQGMSGVCAGIFTTCLMVVARHTLLRDALIFYCRFQHHAVSELIDHAALDFLPRGLTRRVLKSTAPEQGCAAA